ncbi:MAG: hypothetical protein SFX73_08400 [Kofleriaceae bacterium]|nr:hypothetical protein [Kofleriaceae bacterium]
MAALDVLMRPLDAADLRVRRLGTPADARDATFTDNDSLPARIAAAGRPGASRLAAPADHVHASPAPMRIVATGRTTIGAGARVTLVTFKRAATEVFPPGGFVYVADDVNGATWENEVDGGNVIATYHERTATPDELRFRAHNASGAARTIEWAVVALATGT